MTSYQLFIYLDKEIEIIIGKLGTFRFPAGQYIYTGSAKRNIDARIKRHQSNNKKRRWHIDYFLLAPHTRILKVIKSDKTECRLNQLTKGEIIAQRFGASDCKSNCGSHLKYMGDITETE